MTECERGETGLSLWRGFRWFNSSGGWVTCAVVVLVVVAGLGMRVLTYAPPTHNSDAHGNWVAATWMARGVPFEMNFKLSRLGITVPAALIRRVMGAGPMVYSFAPTVAFLIVLVTSYLITERIAGRVPALLVGLAVLVWPWFSYSATQLLPSIFLAAYLGLLTLFVVLYLRGGRWWPYLALAGAALAPAYMSKFTALLVVPGLAVVLLTERVKKAHVALFCVGFLVLYAGEHAYYFSKGIPGGRFQYLWHVRKTGGYTPDAHLAEIGLEMPEQKRERIERRTIRGIGDVHKFFLRYAPQWAGWRWSGALLLWLGSALYLCFLGGRRYRIPVFIMGSHLLFNTFAVAGVAPMRLLTSFQRRYLDMYSGLVFVGCVLGAWHLGRRIVYGRIPFSRLKKLRLPVAALGACAGLVGLVLYIGLPVGRYFHYRALRLINAGRLTFGMPMTKLICASLALTLAGCALYLLVRHGRGVRGRLRERPPRWFWWQACPLLSLGAAWLLLWPVVGPDVVLARWHLPKRVAELRKGEHRIQQVRQHRRMINEAYEAGTLIVSPHLYYAPHGSDVIGRQSVRRAYLFYLNPDRWDSYEDLARVATASFEGDVAVKIDGRDYWGLSRYGKEKMQEAARNLQPEDRVLYLAPRQWTEAEYVTVEELRERTDEFWLDG